MEISNVKITLSSGDNNPRLKGYASFIISNMGLGFVIDNVKIIEGNGRLFVSMPSRQEKNGSYKDVVYPSNRRTRNWIEKIILEEYRQLLFNGK